MSQNFFINNLKQSIQSFDVIVQRQTLIPISVDHTSTYLVIEYHQIKQQLAMQECIAADDHTVHELQASFQTLDVFYTKIAARNLNCAEIHHDYDRIYRDFLYFFHSFTTKSPLDVGMLMAMENKLVLRDWLAILNTYLHHDQPSLLALITTDLDTFIRLHMPQAFIETLGSIHDRAYRCRKALAEDHWWWFREGYAGDGF